jgi:hypothetical protein
VRNARRIRSPCGRIRPLLTPLATGLALTGLTDRGVDLLQAYLDRTGDVQTAALLAAFIIAVRASPGAGRGGAAR